MDVHKERMENLVIRLFEINAFRFGDFKMKVGINSPVYFDLRVMVSYPDVMVSLINKNFIYILNESDKINLLFRMK